jgi:hypothetical protein
MEHRTLGAANSHGSACGVCGVDLGDVSEDREVTVHAEVYDFNPGSGRVLKKVGFEHLTMRKYGIWNDGKLAGGEV